MSEELDWSELEEAVKKASAKLKVLRDENRSLRREVKKLSKALEAGSSEPAADPRLAAVKERLETIESSLESLLP